MTEEPILLGAVAYDPKVVVIWEGIRDHFHKQGVPLEFVLCCSYELQVEMLVRGHLDIAWNTPLAHVRVRRRTNGKTVSLGMRDSDRDFHAKIVVRCDAGIETVNDLEGKRLAVGSRDSTQARILPLHFLKQSGVELSKVEIIAFDTDVGKHGDTGTSEIEVLRALHEGQAEAGTVGDLIWVNEQAAGHVNPSVVKALWTSPPFDHCMFDARPDLEPSRLEQFTTALHAMRWENPEHRRLLELEGLKEWVEPREDGYESLEAALVELGEVA